MKRLCFVILIALVFLFPSLATASSFQNNNIFGASVAVATEADLRSISKMVNTNGAAWGYVTIVIQENNRDTAQWNGIFEVMRQLKLIPIIRIATKPEGENWRRPTKEDADSWVDFLDSLNWPVKNRYVVLFNEPNHGQEWGGQVHPENYGEVAHTFAQKLHNRNQDYFIMLAGFDSAAPAQNPRYEDQGTFLNRMMTTFPTNKINTYIDGWASHSYPNPGFRGKPTDTGRNSIRNYEWELGLLQQKGVKSLPVFITETGWPRSSYSEQQIADYMTYAFRFVWLKDTRVKAVTPFIFNYESEPFQNWSWKKPNNGGYYRYYHAIARLPKIRGAPVLANGSQERILHVYRFWSEEKKSHFYTNSPQERDTILSRYGNSTWLYEGVSYEAVDSRTSGAVPLHRFWSQKTNGHFYTADQKEKDRIVREYSEDVWKYEGIAYYVMPPNGSGSDVFRFYSDRFKKHFYTVSPEERDSILSQYDTYTWRYEGVSWRIP
ncbi:MAG: hypothetical protein ACOCXQ_01225 [Patescibacteria group bacterium]